MEVVTYTVRGAIVGIDRKLRVLATKGLYLHGEPETIVQRCNSFVDSTSDPVDPATLV